MAIVTIVGAGFMGTAVSWPLTDNGHDVRLVGTHLDGWIIDSCKEKRFHPKLKRRIPDGVTPYYIEELPQAIEGADVIVSGVNSNGVHWMGKTIGPHLRPGHMIIAITKGLEATEAGDLRILPDVLQSELPAGVRDQVKIAAIGGPCIAGELAGRRNTCVIFGSRDQAAANKLAGFFRTPYYHIWTTTDLIGLEWGVALKNAFALGVGIATGLLDTAGGVDEAGACNHNVAAGLFAEATNEMHKLIGAAGGSSHYAYQLPGAGDLFVTVQGGRSVRLGRLIGTGLTYDQAREEMGAGETLESAAIVLMMGKGIPRLVEQGKLRADDLPFLNALVDVLSHGKPLNLPFDKFFGGNALA